MQDLELSITICSWNAKEDLRACLASLRAIREEASFEVIVVENNSSDGSGAMVADEFPEVILKQQFVNLGFCGGHNYAVGLMKGRSWLCLNSDTVVHAGSLRKMLDYLTSHPEIGILGPKLLNTDGSLQYSARKFPNPVAAMFRNTILGRLFPNTKAVREYLMKDWDHDSIADVDWVSGSAFLMSNEALQNVGVFDPEYFMFCEDVDLCWRTWKAGYRVVYLPEATITHHIGRSTDKAPNRMIGRFHRSMYHFYTKNQLPEAPRWSRPFLKVLAATALTARASGFILKNKLDRIRRRLSR